MAMVTYTNPDAGFGVTYDDALLTHTDDPADLRLRAAWSMRIPRQIAASVLFTTPDASFQSIARGLAPSLLLTSDGERLEPGVLGRWDWDEVTRREGSAFVQRTGAEEIETTAVYWRGFPVLQLAMVAPPGGDPAAPLQLLGMLYTPEQTLSSLLVIPRGEEHTWIPRLQEVMDGFFLLPIEREGRVRTGHQQVRSLRLTASDLDDDRGVLTS
jgi:hypothetical protein